MKRTFTALLFIIVIACQPEGTKEELFGAEDLHHANRVLVEISMEDIFNPPVATRVFAYPNLGAFEVYNHKYGTSLLNEIQADLLQPNYGDTTSIDYSLAALHTYGLLAKKLVFSEYMADTLLQHIRTRAEESGLSSARIERSIKYGETMAQRIASFIDADGYAAVKADDLYTIRGHDSTWVLTPPNYEPALEPNWKKLRPIFLDDVKNFQPKPRPAFSTDPNSAFYKAAKEVYDQSKANDDSHNQIAKHWDCNPNEFVQHGHNVTFSHRISPPGHWVGITKTMCSLANADFEKTLLAYAATTTAMFDGIIACWHTKYTEELIRPVTYINRYIDHAWQPYIQTPPFPEFTSGHSVVSGCSSSILETIFPNTSFVDYTEVEFGLPARSFASAAEAGLEASNSRFYGGIHYRFGIDNGLEQGQNIGKHILNRFLKK